MTLLLHCMFAGVSAISNGVDTMLYVCCGREDVKMTLILHYMFAGVLAIFKCRCYDVVCLLRSWRRFDDVSMTLLLHCMFAGVMATLKLPCFDDLCLLAMW